MKKNTPYGYRTILLLVVLAALIPAGALARALPGQVRAPDGRPAPVHGGPEAYRDWPVIASLEEVGNNADESVDFALKACTAIRIYAMGEVSAEGMQDYGSIENLDTGQVVWRMYYFETESGGAAPGDRRVDRPISLPAGRYRLHFQTNAARSFDDWGQVPPDERYWGIALYEDVSGEAAAACWERAGRPEDLGWSSEKLEEIIPELERLNCAAFMLVTDGQVVMEWGHTANNFFTHSMRKSLISGLYGVYVAEGRIDLSKTLAELGIDDRTPLTDEEKQATINDLIKARSGVYIPAAGEVPSMRDARPERHSHAPGTFWYYNNWDFNALGTIFDQETGEENLYVAFEKCIAGPTGMQDFDIRYLAYTYEPYSMHPYYGIRISARDLARFGQLFLQQGEWQGQQVLPADWVEESTTPYSLTGKNGTYSGYGYMWWIAAQASGGIPEGSYAAAGYGGHTLEVLPSLNTVIVFRVNTDDPRVPLVGTGEVDQLVAQILEASNRVPSPARTARRLMSGWAVLTAGSLLLLLGWLVRANPLSRGSKLAWMLLAALFGPLGLLAYWLRHRRAWVATWSRALSATLYGMLGHTLGWVAILACFFFLWPSRPPLLTLLVAYAGLLLPGWLLFRAAFLSGRLGRYRAALSRGGLAEAISTNLAFAGMFPLGIYLTDYWFQGELVLFSPSLWLVCLLVALAGAVLVYPFNLWLARRGFACWPGGVPAGELSTGADSPVMPSWRSAWPAFALSLLACIVSVGLVGVFLA